jgi:hypothetical protein
MDNYRGNRTQRLDYMREYQKNWSDDRKLADVVRKYKNFTVDDCKALYESQQQCCAICKCPIRLLSGLNKGSAVIDHDHETGQVRSLLCHPCNLLLGHAKDSPEVLRRAADYLQEHKGKKETIRLLYRGVPDALLQQNCCPVG